MRPLSAIAVLSAVVALWVTRHAWRVGYERPGPINVALQGLKIVLVGYQYDFWLSSKLHTLTGVWNLEDLIGGIGYLIGMFSLLYLVADRLDITQHQLDSFVKYRIGLPACLAMSVMIALYVTGPGRQYISDAVTAETTVWLRGYWLTLLVCFGYIAVQIVQGLLILRRDPRSRRAANAYLCAVGVSVIGALSFVLEMKQLSWVLIRVEVVGYAVAASYTWHSKQHADVLLPR